MTWRDPFAVVINEAILDIIKRVMLIRFRLRSQLKR
jgi:hypothetical protein